jgi:hypothetical protein
MSKRRRRGLEPNLDQLDERCLLSGYSPAQITSAYGLNAITLSSGTVKGDGTGETIALIEMYHDPNLSSDLATFDAEYGLPAPPNLTVDNQAGDQSNNGWALEESMDVEWAHAIAPGANILVVEAAPSNSDPQALANLMAAVQTANTTPGVVVVSMSWGFNEFAGETAYDSDFMTPGITYIAASGDDPGVDYPAASPYVLSVGGTTLTLSGSGSYVSESAWPDSGGGYSQYEAEPSYQESVQQSGERSTPDVAYDGDPNTGVEVYETPPVDQNPFQPSAQGSWQVVGGTSLGAPSWAGILAIADQGRAIAGLGSLSGATQTLPTLYDLASTDFSSVASTQPGNTITEFPGGGFGALGDNFGSGTTNAVGATANTQTGLGSPIGSSLIDDLADSSTNLPLTTSTASPTPTPTPSPAPTPTGATKHHHHKRVAHPAKQAKAKTHATAKHAKRLVAQKSDSDKDKLHVLSQHAT